MTKSGARSRIRRDLLLLLAIVSCASPSPDQAGSSRPEVAMTTDSSAPTSSQVVTTTIPLAVTTLTTIPPTSPSTTEPTTSATAPVTDFGLVGYLGCSMTTDAVIGYHEVGGTSFWEAEGKNEGGAIDLMARGGPSRLWTAFQEELDAHPGTDVLWWELCTTEAGRREDLELGLAILSEIERRIPGGRIFVSAQPAYDGHICPTSGADGPTDMAVLAAQLVETGRVLAGPLQGPLTESMTRDLCHASTSGRLVLGQQLLDFFDV